MKTRLSYYCKIVSFFAINCSHAYHEKISHSRPRFFIWFVNALGKRDATFLAKFFFLAFAKTLLLFFGNYIFDAWLWWGR